MTSPFDKTFSTGVEKSSNTVKGRTGTTISALHQEFYNHALSVGMNRQVPARASAGGAAGGGLVWPHGSGPTVASGGVLVTPTRMLETGSTPSSPVPTWTVDPSVSYSTTPTFDQGPVAPDEQQQQQQQQQHHPTYWIGSHSRGNLPTLIPTPGGVLRQGDGTLYQQLHHQQQQQQQQQQHLALGFSQFPTTANAAGNGLFTFSAHSNGNTHGQLQAINGAATANPGGVIAGPGVGALFPVVTTAPKNSNGSSNGVMVPSNSNGNHGSALGTTTLLTANSSQVLVPHQQRAPVYSTSVTSNGILGSNGVGTGDMQTVAATAAGGMTMPFPLQSFLQINPVYPGLRRLVESPSVFVVDNFFTPSECDALIALAGDYMIMSPVVGAGAGEVSESRTSSSCFLAREDLPSVCSKVVALTGKPIDHLELPQVGRYYTTQKYANHWDAFDLTTEDGRRFAQNGGQRVCTVLVYLNDVTVGGCTNFPRINLRVQPKKGMAVVFFPAALDGTLDPLLLHAAEPAVDTKWVSQIWIRQSTYNGAPTARIPRI